MSFYKLNLLTVSMGNLGSDTTDGDGCEWGLASEFAMANCNCSNFGPRKYRSKLKFTV